MSSLLLKTPIEPSKFTTAHLFSSIPVWTHFCIHVGWCQWKFYSLSQISIHIRQKPYLNIRLAGIYYRSPQLWTLSVLSFRMPFKSFIGIIANTRNCKVNFPRIINKCVKKKIFKQFFHLALIGLCLTNVFPDTVHRLFEWSIWGRILLPDILNKDPNPRQFPHFWGIIW